MFVERPRKGGRRLPQHVADCHSAGGFENAVDLGAKFNVVANRLGQPHERVYRLSGLDPRFPAQQAIEQFPVAAGVRTEDECSARSRKDDGEEVVE